MDHRVSQKSRPRPAGDRTSRQKSVRYALDERAKQHKRKRSDVVDSQRPPLSLRLLRDYWTLEGLSIAFSCACLGAAAAVLAVIDGKTLSQWGRSAHPATLVQLFITLARASLLYPVSQLISQAKWVRFRDAAHPLLDLQTYEDASRSVWGSLHFLYAINVKDFVTSLAAVLVVLSLGMSACTQQSIGYQSRLAPSGSDSASISATRSLNSGLRTLAGASAQPMDTGFQAAMLSGLTARPSQPSYSCPDGTCTFPRFESLGICSFCEDVSALLDRTCTNRSAGVSASCRYTTPSGIVLNATDHSPGNPEQAILTSNATSPTQNFSSTVTGETQSLLVTVDVLTDPFGTSYANECTVTLCARSYGHTNITAGQYSVGPAEVERLSLTSVADGMATYTSLDSAPPGQTYKASTADISSMAATLTALFTTSLTNNNSSATAQHPLTAVDIAPLLHQQGQNIPSLLQNMSDSMTAHLRTASGTSAPGTSLHLDTYMAVEWRWFVAPACAVFAAAFLLLLAAVLNATQRQALWKGSALAGALHGVDWDASGVHAARWVRLSEMEARAAGLEVRLERTVTDSSRLVLC